jgi:hypothetical protein
MNMTFRVAVCASMALALYPISTAAQASPQETKRPKVCIVLSGGVARGAQHAVVLAVLDG